MKKLFEIIKDFGQAVKRAVQAGFSGVELVPTTIRCQQFFSSTSNIVRTDGRNLENVRPLPLAAMSEEEMRCGQVRREDFTYID